jgi:hypothetical protein
MGPIDCPETSVINYQSTLNNIPDERRPSHFLYECHDCPLFFGNGGIKFEIKMSVKLVSTEIFA